MSRHRLLKIKLKSLAAEAKIIRKEEGRSFGDLRCEMHGHRVNLIRSESRHTHLAYGFLRGQTLVQIEPRSYSAVDWERVYVMVKRYGDGSKTQRTAFDRWKEERAVFVKEETQELVA